MVQLRPRGMECLLLQLKGCSLGKAMENFVHPGVVRVGQVAQENVSVAVACLAIGFHMLGIAAFCTCVPMATMQNNLQHRGLQSLQLAKLRLRSSWQRKIGKLKHRGSAESAELMQFMI